MPIRRRNRRMPVRRRRRTNFRRAKRNTRGSYVARVSSTNGVPRRLITKLKYSDTVFMALSGGLGMTTNLWNMNGLYDPDVQTGGHQPYMFDQISALYSRYRVFRCSWRITVPPSTQTFAFTVCPQNGSQNPTGDTQSTLAERPGAITKMSSPGSSQLTFKGTSYLPRLNGVKPAEYKADDRTTGSASANPAEVIQLVLGTSGDTSCTVNYTITLVYHVEFIDPNLVDQS